ncbi:leucyl aminopeptidase family protein [Sanyastnella coralliicola]|uniref:leucyl aminopeptidase family protein n=1 Tax=Sanyastnella coralliicola TaxID=3069118 RepID=UPI0027B97730|nr:leucyl aminopeptidase family protein [Longitalea sp. SCSIO 12813]
MGITLKVLRKIPSNAMVFHLLDGKSVPKEFSKEATKQVKNGLKKKQSMITFVEDGDVRYAFSVGSIDSANEKEALRVAGSSASALAIKQKASKLTFVNHTGDAEVSLLHAEGAKLTAYQFNQLLSDPGKKDHGFREIGLIDGDLNSKEVKDLNTLTDNVFWTRDLVNRPLSHLTATDLADAVEQAGKESGFDVNVLSKRKIQSLKMGGLLAVNKGSIDPPTFTIAEYKPANAVNKQPIVLVGKGVVYDTGGMSLKPTPMSMDFMKSDMAGAAMMAGSIKAIAELELPVHVIALLPATDNRPDGNAYVPGDVITMYDGTTVEVKNTDAEGRLLLADALAYAKKYDPELVMNAATLTGASVRAIGTYATSVMGTADDGEFKKLEAAAYDTYERVVRFPLWDEYGKELASDVADMSNLGRGEAGHISAGKFLQHFTDYPWIHFDIAGPSFLHAPQSYRTKGGTGVGVRLLVEFIKVRYEL